ncbi:MAG: flagellar biosynthetic protein FliO [Thermodesulfovibrionales bacterium]
MNIYLEFFKMLLALAVVLGILYLLTRLLRHRIMNRGGFINIVQYQPLGTKGGIAVVKIGDEYYAIGISEGGFTLITRVEASKIEPYMLINQQDAQKTWKSSITNLFRKDG